MAISAQCACGKSISAKDEYAGKRVKCPACKEPVTLPAAAGGKSASSAAKPATVTTTCECGKSFSAKAALAGKTVKCPGCAKPIKVAGAAPTNPKSAAKSTSDSIAVQCPCGKAIKAPAKFAGKSVKCPACSKPLTIPADNRQPAMATADTDPGAIEGSDLGELNGSGLGFEDRLDSLHSEGVDTDISGMAGLLDELGLESSKTGQRCPNCKSDIDEDTVICIDCGFNIETGKMLKKSSFVKGKKSDTGVGAPKKEKRKGLFGKKK